MFRIGNGYCLSIGIPDRMAADTVLKAESLIAQAFKHGFITLMFEQVHMVSAHKVVIGQAAFTLAWRYVRFGYTGGRFLTITGKRHMYRKQKT